MSNEELNKALEDWILSDPVLRQKVFKNAYPKLIPLPSKEEGTIVHKYPLNWFEAFSERPIPIREVDPWSNREGPYMPIGNTSWLSKILNYVDQEMSVPPGPEQESSRDYLFRTLQRYANVAPAEEALKNMTKAPANLLKYLGEIGGNHTLGAVSPFALSDIYPSAATKARKSNIDTSPGGIFSTLLGLPTTPLERIQQKYPTGI